MSWLHGFGGMILLGILLPVLGRDQYGGLAEGWGYVYFVAEIGMTPGRSLSFLPCSFFLISLSMCVSTFTPPLLLTIIALCLFYA